MSVSVTPASVERKIPELQTASDSESYIARMIEREDICFEIDQAFLDRYPPFVQALKEADEIADMRSDSSDGNYYASIDVGLTKSHMISLVTENDAFVETAGSDTIANGLFTYSGRNFRCGVNYHENYYRLDLTFQWLSAVNRQSGYVAVNITRDLAADSGAAPPSGTTLAPFNNTLVFFNELGSPITVQVSGDNVLGLEPVMIPEGGMADIRLPASWSTPEDDAYHYSVLEYPSIRGVISVSTKYTHECMDREIARSVYSQSAFDLKFPSYLPDGFRSVCNAENTDTSMIQVYANQTAIEFYTARASEYSPGNPFPLRADDLRADGVSGILQVHAFKSYHDDEDPRRQLENRYREMISENYRGFATDPEWFEANSIPYFAYNDGILSIVEVAFDSEHYRITGALPREEIVKIAESLS